MAVPANLGTVAMRLEKAAEGRRSPSAGAISCDRRRRAASWSAPALWSFPAWTKMRQCQHELLYGRQGCPPPQTVACTSNFQSGEPISKPLKPTC